MAQAQVLAGRVAVVTGAANGMARVMARALAGAGAKVAGVDVDAGGLDRLAAEPVFAGKFLNAVDARCEEARITELFENRGARRRNVDFAGEFHVAASSRRRSISAAIVCGSSSGVK